MCLMGTRTVFGNSDGVPVTSRTQVGSDALALWNTSSVVVVERTPAAVVAAQPIEAAPAREGVTVEGEVRFQYNR